VAIKTAPQEVRQFSQIPILAWGVERVYQRNHDQELLKQCLGRLERFHDWFWRERDLHDNGLITLGAYTGKLQHAKWETFDYECNMDGMTMTVHPKRKGPNEGAWYADVCVPGNTAYLIMGERSLARLAEIIGDRELAARRNKRIEKAVKAVREHMWDEQAGTFLAVNRDSLEKIPVATIGSWIPLMAGVPTQAMAKRMAQVLASPAWQTPLPVPTVDRTDKRWKSNAFWRGDVWPSTNYQIASGLAAFGHQDLAANIADKTIANAIEHGISEHYDSVTGKALGVPDYCMSCTVVTMMLDRLAKTHILRLGGKGDPRRDRRSDGQSH
jgi:glycogen debranching enzyme